jgi:lipoate-protein ligase A
VELHLLDHTCPTAEENIALDEALLEQTEQSGQLHEVLRLWESPSPLVVVGRSSRVDEEVNQAACQARGIPILRRSSGGAAIVAGPGCLMYAVVLSYERHPHLRAVDEAHHFVLETMLSGLRPLLTNVAKQGTSDLTLGACKFSGNSMRAKREHLLYHGTLLYDFPLELIAECLGTAPRQPAYRGQREHRAFVTNLPLKAERLRQAVVEAWNARRTLADWPRELTARLATEKYASPEWNFQIGSVSRSASLLAAAPSQLTG